MCIRDRFGAKDASVDAEVIALAMEVLKRAGLSRLALTINSIGCPTCRGAYHQALKDFLRPRLDPVSYTHLDVYKRQPQDAPGPAAALFLLKPFRGADAGPGPTAGGVKRLMSRSDGRGRSSPWRVGPTAGGGRGTPARLVHKQRP